MAQCFVLTSIAECPTFYQPFYENWIQKDENLTENQFDDVDDNFDYVGTMIMENYQEKANS